MNNLTLERAKEIQKEHLSQWESVLKRTIFLKVKEIVLNRNKNVTNPYQICRGSDISNIVQNISIGNLFLYDDEFRINFVKSARKDYPEEGIKKGQSYWWIKKDRFSKKQRFSKKPF